MAEEENVDIKVDMNRVVEKLNATFAKEIASLRHQLAVYEVALEDAINERDDALRDNKELRGGKVQPPGD